ncbi:MAG: polysaccharide deacetylase family protein [Kiloniellaceae bacterium]
MQGWADLTRELDAWAASGRAATLWWRDDDAVEPTAALERLLGLAAAHDAPLALAVIPARASAPLARRLAAARPRATPVQHGFAHRNHASAGEKKCELGAHRPAAETLEELARGRARMDALFGADWLPVLVPPWNRIAPDLLPGLARLGFTGVSTDGARARAAPAPGLTQVNTHVDIMRWEPPRGFLGEAPSLGRLLAHLRARRLGEADRDEPTGLLTHHPAHDDACWDFLERLLAHLAGHPAARFVAPADAFAAAPRSAKRGAA